MYGFFKQYYDSIERKVEISSKQKGNINVMEVNSTKLLPRVINHEETTHGLLSKLSNDSSVQVSKFYPKVGSSPILGNDDIIRRLVK